MRKCVAGVVMSEWCCGSVVREWWYGSGDVAVLVRERWYWRDGSGVVLREWVCGSSGLGVGVWQCGAREWVCGTVAQTLDI